MRTQLLFLVLLFVSLLAFPSLAALTIDNFEEGSFSFTGGTSPTNQTQTSLDPSNTLGGQRNVIIQSLAGGETVSTELVLSGGDDAVHHTSAPSGGSFSLAYGDFGMPTLDLTDGGSADRIEVVVTEAGGAAALELELLDEFSGSAAPSQPLAGAGTYVFPFDAISGVDLTRIQILQVDIDTAATPANFRITEVRASAAPPGVVMPPWVTGSGLLLILAAARRRFRVARAA